MVAHDTMIIGWSVELLNNIFIDVENPNGFFVVEGKHNLIDQFNDNFTIHEKIFITFFKDIPI